MTPNKRRSNTPGFGKTKSIHEVTCPRCDGAGKVALEGISIGDRFRACRMETGKTQTAAAAELAISQAQLANVEGDRSRPGLEMVVRAADAYGVTVDYLLGRT